MAKSEKLNKRILKSIKECDQFISKESARDPDLRPPDVQKILDDYVAHREKLIVWLNDLEFEPKIWLN